MALAQRLNELAASHSQGLLDDDEYRLLRQDLFERFSDTTIIPIESHVIPIESHVIPMSVHIDEANAQASLRVKKTVEFAPSSPPRSKLTPHDEPPTSPRLKPNTVTLGVASLIRRATGRKSSLKDSTVVSQAPSAPINLKRAFIPQILSRKSSSDISIHSASSSTHNDAVSLSSRKTSFSSTTFSPPLSPISATHSTRKDGPLSHSLNVSTKAMGDDIFEDGGLNTTKDIRQAIIELEEEGRRVIDAFNDLERSTIAKVHKGKPSSSTPIAETVVSANWPANPIVRHSRSRTESSRSISAVITSVSGSSSRSSTIWERDRNTPSSRASPLLLSLQRKGSLSSISSRAISMHSVSEPTTPTKRPQRAVTIAARPPPKRKGSLSSLTSAFHSQSTSTYLSTPKQDSTISRSTGHLPLTTIAERGRTSSDVKSSQSMPYSDGEAEVDPEVADVRRRRQEVIGRYEARLEYLRARLKGAELHERLLKR
ncbi:hypothetical protein WG66_016994 [Moniliophthora roreri]|uniref:Uncharacterized protein n=1 Tax=Moniliophthora roreri TaxID=221103 RepID=A0A0W0EXR9_MONRR|nr:hypothetical protein WG66_016994 [Moniliophthora roreri]